MFVSVVSFAAMGLLLVVFAIPLIRRRVKPNRWYGLRVPATFADDSVWYDANALSGRDLLVLGIVQLAMALLIPLVDEVSKEVYVAINAVVMGVGATVVAVVGMRRANRILRERRQGTAHLASHVRVGRT